MSETFKTIAVFQYSYEAQILKGRLASDGIRVFLFDDLIIDTDPLVSNAIGGVKLKVLAGQEKEAIEILKSIKKYSIDDDGNSITCPSCGSEKIELFSTIKDVKSLFWSVFGFLFSSLPFYTKHKYRCQNCSTEFNL